MEASPAGRPLGASGLAIQPQATLPAPTLSGLVGDREFDIISVVTQSGSGWNKPLPAPKTGASTRPTSNTARWFC